MLYVFLYLHILHAVFHACEFFELGLISDDGSIDSYNTLSTMESVLHKVLFKLSNQKSISSGFMYIHL